MKKGIVFAILMSAATVVHADTVNLSTRWGWYWTAVSGGGGAVNASTRSTQNAPATFERFTLGDAECLVSGDVITLRTSGGKYVGISGTTLVATATSAGANEKFTIYAQSTPVSSGGVTLMAANNLYVCASSTGVLTASCSNGASDTSMSLTLTTSYTGAFTVKPVVNMGSPSKVNQALSITANLTGGYGGSTQYKFSVKNGSTVVATSGDNFTNNYNLNWTPSAAGTYTVEARAKRTCQSITPALEAAGSITQSVANVTFSSPSGGSFARGSSMPIKFQAEGLSGMTQLAFFNAATYTTRTIADNVDLSTYTKDANGNLTSTWSLPSDLDLTSQGRIRFTSYSNAGLTWDSANFTVTGVTQPAPEYKFTTRLTKEHFEYLGVTLEQSQVQKLLPTNATAYTIQSIINSTTDRLYDSNNCSGCHSSSNTNKYRPNTTVAIAKNTSIPRGDGTNYTWDQNNATGIVQRFLDAIAYNNSKPDMLEKLFKKWLDSGAQQ